MKNIIIVILLLATAISIGINGVLYNSTQTLEDKIAENKDLKLNFVNNVNKSSTNEIELIREVEESRIPTEEVLATGWIPDWDFNDGFATLKDQANAFNSVSPFFYYLADDGTLANHSIAGNIELRDFTTQNNIDLIPSITNFDPLIMSRTLATEESRRQHIDDIIREIETYGYDGIDLDYESIYREDKEKFFDFLQNLSIEMIERDKKLVFTALAKWGDTVVYKGLAETRMVQDYKRIADLVDELRIMTYEYTGKNPNVYGPNAPLAWIEDTIRYAIYSGVPREKLMIGIGTYSYDYAVTNPMEEIKYYPVLRIGQEEQESFAYYNSTVRDIKNAVEYTEEFNDEWGESVLKFQRNGEDRVLVYPTQQTIDLRKDLAAKYGIGIAVWRLGDEGGELIY